MIVSCALAISLGTWLGRLAGHPDHGQGPDRDRVAAGHGGRGLVGVAIILLSSHFGYSLSTTQVATGSILGVGVGKKGADVRWNVAGRMASAWFFTMPCAALVGAL